MIGWGLRRLIQSLLVILLMTLVVFIGLNAVGNPMDILVGEDSTRSSACRPLRIWAWTSRCGSNT